MLPLGIGDSGGRCGLLAFGQLIGAKQIELASLPPAGTGGRKGQRENMWNGAVDGDGDVGVGDLLALLANLGVCPK